MIKLSSVTNNLSMTANQYISKCFSKCRKRFYNSFESIYIWNREVAFLSSFWNSFLLESDSFSSLSWNFLVSYPICNEGEALEMKLLFLDLQLPDSLFSDGYTITMKKDRLYLRTPNLPRSFIIFSIVHLFD